MGATHKWGDKKLINRFEQAQVCACGAQRRVVTSYLGATNRQSKKTVFLAPGSDTALSAPPPCSERRSSVLECLVPGCKAARTNAPSGTMTLMCPQHWRSVPGNMRRLLSMHYTAQRGAAQSDLFTEALGRACRIAASKMKVAPEQPKG